MLVQFKTKIKEIDGRKYIAIKKNLSTSDVIKDDAWREHKAYNYGELANSMIKTETFKAIDPFTVNQWGPRAKVPCVIFYLDTETDIIKVDSKNFLATVTIEVV
jgi:hypothetical protein